MQSVSEGWKTAQLQHIVPESFIEVSYRISDPAAEADAQASDNGHLPEANTAEIVDNLEKSYSKYLTFEQNSWALNGSGVFLSEVATQNMGYVSSVLSDETGRFLEHPVVTISFSRVFESTIPGITINWSSAFNECANSFIVTAYNGETVVATASVEGNTANTSVVEMPIQGYNKIEIEITEWCFPFRRARIEEIVIGLVKVFSKTQLLGFQHTQSADLLSFELPKAEILFELSNVEGDWNPDNPQGVFKYLLERQEITARYGYKLDGGVEWISAGTFYMSEWETPQNGITASFTARDLLEFMGNPFTATSGNYTLAALARMAFEQSDLPLTKDGSVRWEIDPALEAITVTMPKDSSGAVDFDYSCAETVQLCANAACCVFYQDRRGILHVEPLAKVLSDYVINGFNSYKNAEYNISKELKSVDVNKGMGVSVNGTKGEVQTAENPLIQTEAVATAVAEWVRDVLKNRNTLSGEYRADPRLDVLDNVSVSNKYATNTVFITNVDYRYNGAFKGSYEGRVMT